MPALSVHPSRDRAAPAPARRFASAADGADGSVRWDMKANCSFTPRQLLGMYFGLCVVGLGIGGLFWLHGAPYVLPFAGAELLALGVAIFVYTRHAADRESLVLQPGRFSVACSLGRRTERVEFAAPAWVRVEPAHRDGSLIELSGEGRRISVGRFVRPELRPALADELRTALRRATDRSPA